MSTDQIKRAFATWARSKGIRRPDTAEGMKALFGQFLAEQEARARKAQVIGGGAYHYEIPDGRDARTVLVDDGATVQIEEEARGPADDFEELVHQQNEAIADQGGDELAGLALHQQRQQEALHEQAPFSRTAPPSAQNQILGAQQLVSSKAPNPTTLAMWTGDDIETTPISVIFASVQAVPATIFAGAPNIRATGLVKFGTRGVLTTVEVDIGRGCQFTVAGSSAILEAEVADFGGNEITAQLTGMLSFHPIVRSSTITRTLYVDNLAANNSSGYLVIPPFAQNVILWRMHGIVAPGTGAAEIQVFDQAANLIYTFPIANGALMTEPIALSGDAAYVQILNQEAALTMKYGKVIFGLNL